MNQLTEISARQILGLLENSFDMIDPRLIVMNCARLVMPINC